MKKLLLTLLLLGIFLINFSSAAEFDNYLQDYDEATETITFSNCAVDLDLGLLNTCFIDGSEIGKVQLRTPKNFHVAQGYNYVWELDAWVYEDYNDFLKQFEYLDMKTKIKINRELDVKILSYEEVEVSDYERECHLDYSNSTNGTNICEQIITGTHLETREVWTKVTPADIKKADGKITLRGYTDVREGDIVDWSPVVFGVRVEHDIWSTWTEDLNVDLAPYYKMDDTSGAIVDSIKSYNGTYNGVLYSQAGKINTSIGYDGTNDYIDISNVPIEDFTEITINMWIRANDTTSAHYPFSGLYSVADDIRITLNANNLNVAFDDGSVNSLTTPYSDTTNFNMVTTQTNSTGTYLYLNGVLKDSNADTFNFAGYSGTNTRIGVRYSGVNPFLGEIDEFGIWNRSLTPSEITQLDNNGNGITYTDQFGPQITLISPINNTNLTSSSVDLIANVTDAIKVDNVTLYINGAANETNTSGFSGPYTFSKTLPVGDYNWSILAWNNQSFSTQSGTRMFTIGDIIVTLNSPADNETVFNNLVTSNASANVSGGATLINMSLWTNESGSWELNQTNTHLFLSDAYINWSDYTETEQTGGSYKVHVNQSISNYVERFTGNQHPTGSFGTGQVNCRTTFTYNDTSNYIIYSPTTIRDDGYITYNFTNPNKTTLVNNILYECNAFSGSDYDSQSNIKEIWTYAENNTNSNTWVFGNGGLFNLSIINDIIWNAQACGSDGYCEFAESNYTIFLDPSKPQIDAESPVGILDYNYIGGNETLNVTFTDTNLAYCWYDYNGTNVTIEGCLSGVKNSTQFLLEEGNYNMTIYANDSAGNFNSSFTEWEYKILEINQTYMNETIEGNLQNISATIKLGDGLTISAAILNYNGTLSSGISSDSGENKIILKSNLVTPAVSADENITFQWSIILSGGEIINITEKNQTIKNIGIDNCSVFTNKIINMTILDEEEQTVLSGNTTLEVALNILSSDRSITILSFSQEFDDINPASICINQIIEPGIQYSLDSIMRYTAQGYSNEYYNVVDMALTNDTGTTEYNLYSLNETRSTEFQLTFKGTDFLPVEDALVFVERQYISEDVFKTVEVPKTDSNGQTVLHLTRNSVIYNIKFVKDDEILRIFNNVIAFCQDFTIGSCTMSLNAVSNESGIFNYDDSVGILYNSQPDYNKTSKVVSFSFTSTDGSTQNIFMEVERNDIFGNRSICNNTVVSPSGTLSCTITEEIDDTTLITKISVDSKEWLTFSTIIDDTAYGSAGYVFWFVLTLVLLLMFGDSKNGVMISLLVSYFGAISLGVAIGGIVGVGSTGVWVMVITMVGIWKINKNRRS